MSDGMLLASAAMANPVPLAETSGAVEPSTSPDETAIGSRVFNPIKVVGSALEDEPWKTSIGRESLDQWQVQDWSQLANRIDAGGKCNTSGGCS